MFQSCGVIRGSKSGLKRQLYVLYKQRSLISFGSVWERKVLFKIFALSKKAATHLNCRDNEALVTVEGFNQLYVVL